MGLRCQKIRFKTWTAAVAWATTDEQIHGDKRKVYFCKWCSGYHTSREKVKTNVPITER